MGSTTNGYCVGWAEAGKYLLYDRGCFGSRQVLASAVLWFRAPLYGRLPHLFLWSSTGTVVQHLFASTSKIELVMRIWTHERLSQPTCCCLRVHPLRASVFGDNHAVPRESMLTSREPGFVSPSRFFLSCLPPHKAVCISFDAF